VSKVRSQRTLLWVVGLLLVASLVIMGVQFNRGPARVRAEVVGYAPAGDSTGFERATAPRAFDFPADHGPHPRFQMEWWYYTGNVQMTTGRAFGYQLTFFRRALASDMSARSSEFATNQVFMAHFALTDVEGHHFYSTERWARGAAGQAGAQGMPYRVWLDDWSASASVPGSMHLVAENEGVALDLMLREVKAPVLQGDAGLSQKSTEVGNASYYYSLTRLETQGVIRVNGQAFTVRGPSWMDHEFGTSSLGPNAVGWDWFSLQLVDGRELMYFRIRRSDGSIEPVSGGVLVEPDGRQHRLYQDDVHLEVLSFWQSPRTGARYPARWRLRVVPTGEVLEVVPVLADQELQVTAPYWEGAVRVYGGAGVVGVGYVEMTGYVGSMRDRF